VCKSAAPIPGRLKCAPNPGPNVQRAEFSPGFPNPGFPKGIPKFYGGPEKFFRSPTPWGLPFPGKRALGKFPGKSKFLPLKLEDSPAEEYSECLFVVPSPEATEQAQRPPFSTVGTSSSASKASSGRRCVNPQPQSHPPVQRAQP